MHDKFELLRRGGQTRAALRVGETLVALGRRAFGPYDAHVAQMLAEMSALERAQGLSESAETHLREADAILQQTDPAATALQAHVAAELAALLAARGESAAARDLYVRAIDFTIAADGPESPTVAILLNNVALLYHATGDLVEAEMRYRWAGAIYEKLYGGQDAQSATVLHNIGNLLIQLERYDDARSTLEKASTIRAENLQPDDPTLAQTWASLAVAQHHLGDLDGARKLYERTMRIFQKHLPALAADFRTTAENLSSLLRSVGQTRQADSLQIQVRKQVVAG